MVKLRKHSKNALKFVLVLSIITISLTQTHNNKIDSLAFASTDFSYNPIVKTGETKTYIQKFTDKLENKDVKIEYKRNKVTFKDGYNTYQYKKVKTYREKSDKIYTKKDNYTFKTGQGKKMKKWYAPHNGLENGERRTLQNIVFGKGSDAYLSYATGDLLNDGYIYHYNSKGKLLSKSPKLEVGHGQSVSYYDGSFFIGSDVPDVSKQRITKYDPETWTVKQSWKVPETVKVGTMTMVNERTAVVARKYDVDRGYELITLKLDKDADTARISNVKRYPKVVGTTKQYELQSIAFYEGHYYLATNGWYVKIKKSTGKRTDVRMNIERENEGIGFTKTGRLVWSVAMKNQLFIEKQ